MATIVLQAAGAFLGGAFGAVGSAIGSAAGAIAGYALDRSLIESTRRLEGPRLTGARPFSAEEGAPLARVYGTVRVGGTMIWATRFEETSQTTRQGFKGGPRTTTYSYFGNVAFGLCEGPIAGVRRIWADGREIDQDRIEFRIYRGGDDQAPDPLIQARQGDGNAPAYRGTAYVVFDHLPLDEYGNRIPQFQFEVMRPIGDLGDRMKAVALLPGSTEYGLSPTPVTRQVDEGETVNLNRHVLHGTSDLVAALDELQALCPNIEHVALVVSWFGDDLRAGECRVRPAVTHADSDGLSQAWVVSGTNRSQAPLVSKTGGASAYGGTPSDRSVIDAIAEIKSRGLKVTLYPFIMMDIAADNTLADPYTGEAGQPAYPWRGRISCAPAPLAEDSADGTTETAAQIDAFCGEAGAGDFTAGADTIAYSGASDDWGYRRFILHYAHLSVAAGGVDAFLIGSELRGLTGLRDGDDAFPFVDQLCRLAEDASEIMGAETALTYAADWSEYFGHHPQDGSGDVFFHLDALWMHPAINAIGIDNYMPLADWRDGDYAGGNPDGFSGPYDRAGLGAAINSGEGFDWYYASMADREARERKPITDGAYEKPWVYRYKDLVGWWSNLHFNRSDGDEADSPTEWAPCAKPIWFTELGCPAVDKGPNQPNVFPDPKSAENAIPYFSNGGRSDTALRNFIGAHQDHWIEGASSFSETGNPQSSVYSGRMVDASRIYNWAWDARPFPAFPQLVDSWADGNNWLFGHWLSGRLNGVAVADLVNTVLADHKLPEADTTDCEGTLDGYLISDPDTARNALEPLVTAFGIAVSETDGKLKFHNRDAGRPVLEIFELVAMPNEPVTQAARTPDSDLPSEITVRFADQMNEYQAATARVARQDADAVRSRVVNLPAVVDPALAESLGADLLHREWTGRETLKFSAPTNARTLEIGSSLRIPEYRRDSEYLVVEIDDGIAREVTARRRSRRVPTPWRPALLAREETMQQGVGAPLALFLDLPMLPGISQEEDQFRIAVRAKPWVPHLAFASPADTGFTQRAQLAQRATIGRLTNDLGSGFAGVTDRGTTIEVGLLDGELSSVDRLRLLSGANAAAVQSRTGRWEILQFETADEIAPSRWRLGGLLRGQAGTEAAMNAGADNDAYFVLLDQAVRPVGLKPGESGLTLNWRVGPVGFDLSSPGFGAWIETGGIRAALPLSPVHLRREWLSGGDLSLSWIRRGRIDADAWHDGDIPLGEESEAYRVTVSSVGGGVVRTADTPVSTWLYAAAEIAADFPDFPVEIAISVSQTSASAGLGDAAELGLSLT